MTGSLAALVIAGALAVAFTFGWWREAYDAPDPIGFGNPLSRTARCLGGLAIACLAVAAFAAGQVRFAAVDGWTWALAASAMMAIGAAGAGLYELLYGKRGRTPWLGLAAFVFACLAVFLVGPVFL